MTKMTVEQAISAVQVATTEDAVKAALMTCTMSVMMEVCDTITGSNYGDTLRSMKKDKLASMLAGQIMHWREEEAFRALPYEEKFDAVMKIERAIRQPRAEKLKLFSLEELKETARRLDLASSFFESDSATEHDKWLFIDEIVDELMIRRDESEIESLMETVGVANDVHHKLLGTYVRPKALARVCEKYGLSVPEDKDSTQMGIKLYEYYELLNKPEDRTAIEPKKFQIGHHYRENGGAPQSIYTLIERIGDWGYFVDTFNVYYRRKIRASGGCEYANSPSAKSGANATSTLRADREVPVHEIISDKHGNASVMLHAGQVNNLAELDLLLKEVARQQAQAQGLPAIESSIVRAENTERIRAILKPLTNEELKEYAARNLLTYEIPLNGDILSSIVDATENAIEVFWMIRKADRESNVCGHTPTTPLSRAWSAWREIEDLKSQRKNIQQGLHELWMKRRTLRDVQGQANFSLEESEALDAIWQQNGDKLCKLFADYRRVSLQLSERRCEHEEIPAGREEGISDTANAGGRGSEDAA